MFSAPIFRVKRFFLKKNLSLRSRPWGRRRRLPKEGRSPCQPGFSAILRAEDRDLPDRKKPPEGAIGFPVSLPRRFDWSAETMSTALRKQEVFRFCLPVGLGDFSVSLGPAASPSPSEAAIYEPPSESASGFFVADEDSRGLAKSGAGLPTFSRRYRSADSRPRARSPRCGI